MIDGVENLPTSFALPPVAVDQTREVASQLLRGSQDFRRLVKALNTADQ
jgi:hypothetical protein